MLYRKSMDPAAHINKKRAIAAALGDLLDFFGLEESSAAKPDLTKVASFKWKPFDSPMPCLETLTFCPLFTSLFVLRDIGIRYELCVVFLQVPVVHAGGHANSSTHEAGHNHASAPGSEPHHNPRDRSAANSRLL